MFYQRATHAISGKHYITIRSLENKDGTDSRIAHERNQFLFHDHIDMVTIEFAKSKRDVAERYSTDVSSHLSCHLHAFSSCDLSSWDLSSNPLSRGDSMTRFLVLC